MNGAIGQSIGFVTIAGGSGEVSVVASNWLADEPGEVCRQAATPRGEVSEDQDALAGVEDQIGDLLEAGQLAGASGERLSVVVVCGGWLQICLSAVIAALRTLPTPKNKRSEPQ